MINILDQIIQDGVDRGLLQNFTMDEKLDSSLVTINDEKLINFGSCSYLGLEYHEKLKFGVEKALHKYGTQFSTSRTYLSIGLYKDLEIELEKIFEKPLLISASTTLGHLAAMPVLIEENDAVILDLQVHSSVQMTSQILKAKKVATFVIPHNNMEYLEEKIKSLSNKYDRIWYLADGVYSMYGDVAPLKVLEGFLNKYKKFHLYLDDAHGMGWTGKNGCGYVRTMIDHHNKMVLATSLNKSFAASGGIIIFPNEEWKRKVQNCGTTMIFSGPIQPPMLGAAIASAKLHSSKDILKIQEELKEKVAYTNRRLQELGLPQYRVSDSPLFFIPVGLPKITRCILRRLKSHGYYMNGAAFPAVPMKKGGIRFMINNNLSFSEIEGMLTALQREYVLGLIEENSSLGEVEKLFGLPPINIDLQNEIQQSPTKSELTEEFYLSITEINQQEWDNYFTGKGTLSYANLLSLEKLFRNQELPENNWSFFYHIVRDKSRNIVLISAFTKALMMDDLLADRIISEKVMEKRKEDPYFLTSETILSGTPFTKGKSVFLNTRHQKWKEALALHVNRLHSVADKHNASKIIMREFDRTQLEAMKEYMLELGMVETQLLNNCVIPKMDWDSTEEFLQRIGPKYRNNFRKEISKHEDQFLVETDKSISNDLRQKCYELYSNVHANALDISVFKLPFSLFNHMFEDSSFDILRLYRKDDIETPAAVMFSNINGGTYYAMIVGLDYDYVRTHNTYKQILYRTVVRAKELGCSSIDLAYTAEMEKKKVGAIPEESFAFTLALEHYSYAQIESLK